MKVKSLKVRYGGGMENNRGVALAVGVLLVCEPT